MTAGELLKGKLRLATQALRAELQELEKQGRKEQDTRRRNGR